jgi:predicted SAM-dependent methyltransferase
MLKALKDYLRPYWHRVSRPNRRVTCISETSKCRSRLAPFCTGSGLDLGFGGDPIHDGAIRMDSPDQYGAVGRQTAQLRGDAADLRWFRDGTLDFVFSSHLLEDFTDTEAVLREWWRVLRTGGRLIIFCPDEQVYRAYCARTGHYQN